MGEKLPPKIFTCLDLEMNQDPIEPGKIIQIGAVVGNIETGEIIDKLSIFVNPNQKLTDYIIKLTKIKQEHVDNGVILLEGYEQLKALHKRHNSFVNPIVWGQGDVKHLTKELGMDNLCFGRREIDVKTLYVSWRIANSSFPNGGLSRAMANLGLKFSGCAHRADDDALNTFSTYVKLTELLKDKK